MDESHSVPQLPSVVLTKVLAMFQWDQHDDTCGFQDRLQLAGVNRQLRQEVIIRIQQTKRRMIRIRITDKGVFINRLSVRKSSLYYPMDCIDALLAFDQPNALIIHMYGDVRQLSQFIHRILTLSTLTFLEVSLDTETIGEGSTLDRTLDTIASVANMELLKIHVRFSNYCFDASAQIHLKSSPCLPLDSPFNHLLTLTNLRALRIDAQDLLSWAQMANLLNRSASKFSHICCNGDVDVVKLFTTIHGRARGNITSICCVKGRGISRFLARLPNCRVIHYRRWIDPVDREEFDASCQRLLDSCHADDAHRGKTLEWDIGIGSSNRLEMYLQEGGERQIDYTRDDTVVRLSIGSNRMMREKHCPFYSSCDYP